MDILAPVKTWLLTVALKKAAVSLGQAVASYAAGHAIGGAVSVDPDKLAAMILAGSEIVRNFLKTKCPRFFSWL